MRYMGVARVGRRQKIRYKIIGGDGPVNIVRELTVKMHLVRCSYRHLRGSSQDQTTPNLALYFRCRLEWATGAHRKGQMRRCSTCRNRQARSNAIMLASLVTVVGGNPELVPRQRPYRLPLPLRRVRAR